MKAKGTIAEEGKDADQCNATVKALVPLSQNYSTMGSRLYTNALVTLKEKTRNS